MQVSACNLLFHPFHSSHSSTVKALSVITIVALSIITCGLYVPLLVAVNVGEWVWHKMHPVNSLEIASNHSPKIPLQQPPVERIPRDETTSEIDAISTPELEIPVSRSDISSSPNLESPVDRFSQNETSTEIAGISLSTNLGSKEEIKEIQTTDEVVQTAEKVHSRSLVAPTQSSSVAPVIPSLPSFTRHYIIRLEGNEWEITSQAEEEQCIEVLDQYVNKLHRKIEIPCTPQYQLSGRYDYDEDEKISKSHLKNIQKVLEKSFEVEVRRGTLILSPKIETPPIALNDRQTKTVYKNGVQVIETQASGVLSRKWSLSHFTKISPDGIVEEGEFNHKLILCVGSRNRAGTISYVLRDVEKFVNTEFGLVDLSEIDDALSWEIVKRSETDLGIEWVRAPSQSAFELLLTDPTQNNGHMLSRVYKAKLLSLDEKQQLFTSLFAVSDKSPVPSIFKCAFSGEMLLKILRDQITVDLHVRNEKGLSFLDMASKSLFSFVHPSGARCQEALEAYKAICLRGDIGEAKKEEIGLLLLEKDLVVERPFVTDKGQLLTLLASEKIFSDQDIEKFMSLAISDKQEVFRSANKRRNLEAIKQMNQLVDQSWKGVLQDGIPRHPQDPVLRRFTKNFLAMDSCQKSQALADVFRQLSQQQIIFPIDKLGLPLPREDYDDYKIQRVFREYELEAILTQLGITQVKIPRTVLYYPSEDVKVDFITNFYAGGAWFQGRGFVVDNKRVEGIEREATLEEAKELAQFMEAVCATLSGFVKVKQIKDAIIFQKEGGGLYFSFDGYESGADPDYEEIRKIADCLPKELRASFIVWCNEREHLYVQHMDAIEKTREEAQEYEKQLPALYGNLFTFKLNEFLPRSESQK